MKFAPRKASRDAVRVRTRWIRVDITLVNPPNFAPNPVILFELEKTLGVPPSADADAHGNMILRAFDDTRFHQ
jgi:hypothetical protein